MDSTPCILPVAGTRSVQPAWSRLARLESSAALAGASPDSDGDAALRAEAAHEMASLFVYQLVREMRKMVPKSGLWDGGHAQEIYEQMIDERLAETIASSRQFGLAKIIEDQVTGRS